MSKITLNNVGNIIDATTAATTINANNAVIQTAMDNTLSRNGTTPNTMGSNLDMNNFQVLNLPTPATANSPARLKDVQTGGTITNIPPGGTTGQVLAKTSNVDYAINWTSESAELVAGTNIVLTGTTPTTISTISQPSFFAPTIQSNVSNGAGQLGYGSNQLNIGDGAANHIIVSTDQTQTLTNKTLTTPILNTPTLNTPIVATGTPTNAAVLGYNAGLLTWGDGANNRRVVGDDTAQTLTNKTYDTAGTGNSFLINSLAATANTGTGSVVRATSPTLITPVLGVATVTTINSSTVSPGHYTGEPSTGSASAGEIGEYVQSDIASGSAVSISSSATTNLTSISLTAGDWDVSGMLSLFPAATTSITVALAGLTSTTASLDQTLSRTGGSIFSAVVPGNNSNSCHIPIGPCRFSLSSTTTIFLVGFTTFSVSTMTMFG